MKTQEIELLSLLDQFINENENGTRLTRSGTKITAGTLESYKNLRKLLARFSIATQFSLCFPNTQQALGMEFNQAQDRWKDFDTKLREFMLVNCKYSSGYTGTSFRLLKSFIKYLNKDKPYHLNLVSDNFRIVTQKNRFIALSPEQLNYLIYHPEFEKNLPNRLKPAKDIFVFGCTVGLRAKELLALKRSSLERTGSTLYLTFTSGKGSENIKLKLPDYCIQVIERQSSGADFILPQYHLYTLNKYFREIGELAGWTELISIDDNKLIYPSIDITNNKYRFCDLLTTHTMRRTAITTLLSLGMPENVVRKISGHSPGSYEFNRYVKYSQEYLNQETERVFSRLQYFDGSLQAKGG